MVKSAIVTGSTSGIGKAIAYAFAANGYNVMLNGFGDAGEIAFLQETLSNLNKSKISYSPADMSSSSQIKGMIQDAYDQFGSVDVLVNNAGIQHVDFVEDFPEEKWNLIIAVNLSAAFHTIRHSMPYMRKQKWGRIINIASAHGLVASAKKSAYVAAKHGIVGLTKSIALETVGTGITCNSICPGWVLTPLVQKQIDAIAEKNKISIKEAELQLLSEKQPSREFVSPEQIASLALYLCGDSAKSITGSALSMDGGWTAQ